MDRKLCVTLSITIAQVAGVWGAVNVEGGLADGQLRVKGVGMGLVVFWVGKLGE